MLSPSTLELAVLTGNLHQSLGFETELPPPSVGKFRVVRLLGSGGGGDVYEAIDEELDRQVALKLLRKDWGTSSAGRDFSHHEARAMARVEHENVVRIYEVGRWNERVFVAMQLVRGGNLRQWIDRRDIGLEEKLEALIKAGDGLFAIHRRGLVHLDFKPENVLLESDGTPRVVDFGLARSHRSHPLHVNDKLDIEVWGGTPGYVAPEILDGNLPNPAADQYGFAATLYEVLYGALPHPNSPRSLRRNAPRNRLYTRKLGAVVARALALDPNERWLDLGEFLNAIRRCKKHTRRRTLVILGTTAVIAGGWKYGAAGLERAHRQTQCASALSLADDSLSATTLASIDQAFMASGAVHAGEASSRTRAHLLEQKQAAVEHLHQACESPLSELARAAFVERIGCASKMLGRIEVVAQQLMRAEGPVVDHAVSSVLVLVASRCDDSDDGFASQDSDPATTAVRAGLFQADLQLHLGLAKQASDTMSTLANTTSMPAPASTLAGEVEVMLGQIDVGRERYLEAYDHFTAALRTKPGQGRGRESRPTAALRAAVELISVSGQYLGRPQEALTHATYASALATSLPEEKKSLARLAEHKGRLHLSRGEYQDADRELRAAISAMTTENWAGAEAVPALLAYATSLNNQRKHHAAKSELERAEYLVATLLGSSHPLNVSVWLELGRTLRLVNDYEQAVVYLRRADDLAQRSSAPAKRQLVEIHSLLSACQHRLGRRKEALDEAITSRELATALYGEEGHPELAQALAQEAMMTKTIGDLQTAETLHARALDMLDTTSSQDDPRRAVMLLNSASLQLSLNHFEKAREQIEAGIQGEQATYGPEHLSLVQFYYVQNDIAKASGRKADARRALSSALNLLEHNVERVLANEKRTATDVTNAYGQLLSVLRRIGDIDKTAQRLQESLEQLKQLPDCRLDQRWSFQTALAEQLIMRGDCDRALKLMQELDDYQFPHPDFGGFYAIRALLVRERVRSCWAPLPFQTG